MSGDDAQGRAIRGSRLDRQHGRAVRRRGRGRLRLAADRLATARRARPVGVDLPRRRSAGHAIAHALSRSTAGPSVSDVAWTPATRRLHERGERERAARRWRPPATTATARTASAPTRSFRTWPGRAWPRSTSSSTTFKTGKRDATVMGVYVAALSDAGPGRPRDPLRVAAGAACDGPARGTARRGDAARGA